MQIVGALFLGLFGLATANPSPQKIDYSGINAAGPVPAPTISLGVASQFVSYDPNVAAKSAAADVSAHPLRKRWDDACASQALGHGPIPTPDTASAFLKYPSFASIASSAPIPTGYKLAFTNLNASNVANGYLGFVSLKTYDPKTCASKCDWISDCHAFNIFFERDPTLNPGPNCPNPPSTNTIKCVFWGGPVTTINAVNKGIWRNNFQVVIAGSNGYTSTSLPSIPNYSGPNNLGKKAIFAPSDCNGHNTYIGYKLYNDGAPFDPARCAAACSAETSYKISHPNSPNSAMLCKFFNTYILYKNGVSQGQICAMYNQTWANGYATNTGKTTGNDIYTIDMSYTYSNTTDQGTCLVKSKPTTQSTTQFTSTTSTSRSVKIVSISTTWKHMASSSTMTTPTMSSSSTTATLSSISMTTTSTGTSLSTVSTTDTGSSPSSSLSSTGLSSSSNNSPSSSSNNSPSSSSNNSPSSSSDNPSSSSSNNFPSSSSDNPSSSSSNNPSSSSSNNSPSSSSNNSPSSSSNNSPSSSTSNSPSSSLSNSPSSSAGSSSSTLSTTLSTTSSTSSSTTSTTTGMGLISSISSTILATSSSTTTTTTSSTPTPSSMGGFLLQGCYNGGFLSGKSIPNGNITLESCAAFCNGYTYMAVENGVGCSCGFYTNDTSTTNSTGCNVNCAGNSAETCGGFGAKNLYQNSANSNTSPAPQQLAIPDQTSINGFVPQGCFIGGFLLSKSIPNGNITIESCAAYCTGYSWMSVENGNGCSCGFSLTRTPTPASGCYTSCAGNSNETCGGFSRRQLYNNPANSNNSPAPQQLATIDQIPINGFVPQGCFGGGLLISKSLPASNISIESCASYCTGYTWMTVQNGNSCSCGFNLNGTSTTPVAGCYSPCSGNSSETCGSFSSRQLYQNSANTNTSPFPQQLAVIDQTPVRGFVPQGCFQTGLLISKSIPYSNTTTIESCAAYCTGYTWMALENGYTCSCGFNVDGTFSSPMGGCWSTCLGNSSEFCGGSGRKQLYQNNANSNTSPAPQQLALIDQTPTRGFIPQGCFSGNFLTGKSKSDPANTIESCASYCTGYTWMSIEGASGCSCGFSADGNPSSNPHGGCWSACPGNSSEFCGGNPGYNTLYKNPSNINNSPSPQQLAPPDQTPIGSFIPQGCFIAGFNAEINYQNNSNTLETCASFCTGYPWMSIENGYGCSCGFSPNSTVLGGTAASGCYTPCTGNNAEICGGFSHQQIYKSSTATVGGFQSVGCFSGGYLSSTNFYNNSDSVEFCANYCRSYQYFSLEDGHACSCGNQPNGTAPGGIKNTGCTTRCAGNTTELCGGFNRNILYQHW